MGKDESSDKAWCSYDLLRWFCILSLAGGAFLTTWAFFVLPHKGVGDRHDIYLNFKEVEALIEIAKDPQNPSGLSYASAINHKIGSYHSFLGSMNSSVLSMATLCALMIVVTVRKEKVIKIPWIHVELPLMLFLWMLPFLGLYLWTGFGYTLNTCLDARLNTATLLKAQVNSLQKPPASDLALAAALEKSVVSTASDRKQESKIHYTLTRASELEDRALIDGWFWAFYHDDFLISTMTETGFVVPGMIMIAYSILLGCVHVMILSSLLYAHFHTRSLGVKWASGGVAVVALIVLLGSNYTFYVTGMHPNWVQPLIFGFATLIFFGVTHHSVLARFALIDPPTQRSRFRLSFLAFVPRTGTQSSPAPKAASKGQVTPSLSGRRKAGRARRSGPSSKK